MCVCPHAYKSPWGIFSGMACVHCIGQPSVAFLETSLITSQALNSSKTMLLSSNPQSRITDCPSVNVPMTSFNRWVN